MKQKNITLFILCYLITVLSFAQDCTTAFYLSEGKTVVYTRFDSEGKVIGKDHGTISDVIEEGGIRRSTYRLIKYEKDGKVKEDGTAKIVCENGTLKISFQVPDMKKGTSNEAFFLYPGAMKPGQALESKLEMNINGVVEGKKTDVYFKVENRRVTAKETVKTLAGSYEASKIEYDLTIRIKVLGIGIPMKLRIHEWFSLGFGIVKTQTFNKDGLLQDETVLSSVK